MDGFFALIVAVNNHVKYVTILAFQRNELFSCLGAGANIVDQRQITVRCQRVAAARHAADKELPEVGQLFFIKRKRNAADTHGTVGGVGDGQIAAVHIAHTGGQQDFYPIAVPANHIDHRAVGELRKRGVVQSRAGADIQVAAVGRDRADLFRFLCVCGAAFGGRQRIIGIVAAAGKGGNGENPDTQEHQQQADKNARCFLSHGSTPPFPKWPVQARPAYGGTARQTAPSSCRSHAPCR